jgi:hypothetical protein
MLLSRSIPFTFENKEYEIKVFYNDTLINILVFLKNYPVNGLRHYIKISKNLSVKMLLERKVIDELVDLAKKDILEKRWERLLQTSTNKADFQAK